MGAFDVVRNIAVPDDEGDPVGARLFRAKWHWDPHEIVFMRGTFSAGDQEAVGNAATSASKKGDITYRGGSGRIALLVQMIVDWTFTANGRKVEVTPQAIKRLPANYSNPLLEKCDELAAAMTEEEQEDFFDSANGHFPIIASEASLSRMP
jgi:hypothetical protein